jgi:Mg2+/Co2+ transporter CorB
MSAWIISFLCSGCEIGFLSVNELKINALAKKGKKSAKIMQILLKDKEKVITTILICNNITLVLLTFAFGGIILGIFRQGIPESLETIILTIIVFTTCELFPKSLFRIYSFELTYRFSWLFFFFYIIFYPISWFFAFITKRFKHGEEENLANRRLNEVAAEGARRRLLPAGVSVLVNKFSDKKLKFSDISNNIETTTYCGKNNITINSTQSMDEIIKKNLLWHHDTIECRDNKKGVYYPTVTVLDALFKL